MKVKSIEFIGYENVYNMEVENHHNFAVNGGFIVHNCDALRYFIAGRPCPVKPKRDAGTGKLIDKLRPKQGQDWKVI